MQKHVARPPKASPKPGTSQVIGRSKPGTCEVHAWYMRGPSQVQAWAQGGAGLRVGSGCRNGWRPPREAVFISNDGGGLVIVARANVSRGAATTAR